MLENKYGMLVLTRSVGESLIIGNDVVVSIVDVIGHQIKLGVKAPKRVAVEREEVLMSIQQEKVVSANRVLLNKKKKCCIHYLHSGKYYSY